MHKEKKKIAIISQKKPDAFCDYYGIKKNVYGGWVDGFLNETSMIEGYEVYCLFECEEFKTISINRIIYIPIKNGKWQIKIDELKPDIVQVFGTENDVLRNKIKIDSKTVVWVQGLLAQCVKQLKIDIKEHDKLDNVFLNLGYKMVSKINERAFVRRSENEKEIIKQIKHVIGRTDWDQSCLTEMNPALNYHYCNELMRSDFYSNQMNWDSNDMERHSIFISQGNYPIKGLHLALEIVTILKNKYSDVRLYVAGGNILQNDSLAAKLKISYSNYILYLIKKHDLLNHVIFTGQLTQDLVRDKLMKSNVFLLPSLIENSPNSLAEAQLIGVPIVASCVGGVPDFIVNSETGYLYPCFEVELAAKLIGNIFDDDDKARMFSDEGINFAKQKYSKEEFRTNIVAAYEKIMEMDSKEHSK